MRKALATHLAQASQVAPVRPAYSSGLRAAIATIGPMGVHAPWQLMIIIFIGAALTVALLPLNYGLYSFVLTPTFVLLAETEAIDHHLAWLRVGNTVSGALIATLAALLLWPASERGRVRDDLAAALDSLAELVRCIAECDEALIPAARRAFSVAAENAAASLQRLLSDESSEDEEAMMAVLIYTRRVARNIHRSPLPPPEARAASATLHELAQAIRERRAPRVEREVSEPLAGLASAIPRLIS